MAILAFDESTATFKFNPNVDLKALASNMQKGLFGEQAYGHISEFIEPKIAEQIRSYYFDHNAAAFKKQKTPKYTFDGQSSIYYYLRSPHPQPKFIMSLIWQMSVFRNMVYSNQTYYQKYCAEKGLNPENYEEVLKSQSHHTWARMSWYKERDGQNTHKDNYGELASFLFLSQKGQHWKKGGLFLYDEDGERTVEVDALCKPGDFLMLDQYRVNHGVEPIIGANPGRLLLYVPIIPAGYMQRWFTFEAEPWKVYFTKNEVSLAEKIKANLALVSSKLRGNLKVHHSRTLFEHKKLDLK